MIDLKVTSVGGPEIAAKLADVSSGLRDEIRAELAKVGEEVVAQARSLAPRRTGGLQARIIWFFGVRGYYRVSGARRGTKAMQIREGVYNRRSKKWDASPDGNIRFEVMPTGSVAHLMERGVNASFYQRPGRRGKDKVRTGRHVIGPFAGEAMHGPDWRYPRTLTIAPRPFFQPAVDSVGGPAGVNARLQSAIDRFAQEAR